MRLFFRRSRWICPGTDAANEDVAFEAVQDKSPRSNDANCAPHAHTSAHSATAASTPPAAIAVWIVHVIIAH